MPRSVLDPWDAWLQRVLTQSRALLGEAWEPAWLEAPVWRFALPANQCGPDPLCGVLLPSVDRAGRYFPLTIARLGGLNHAFLEAAEAAGRAAIADDWPPSCLLDCLSVPAPEADGASQKEGLSPEAVEPSAEGWWWTTGGPHPRAGRLVCLTLPEAATFGAMLLDPCEKGLP